MASHIGQEEECWGRTGEEGVGDELAMESPGVGSELAKESPG